MKKFFQKQYFQWKLPYLLIIIFAGLTVLPQFWDRVGIIGSDAIFHYNRFYDAAMQIKNHNFQYFISMYGFQQSGRIVNALYGPVFAYFQGILVLICGSWFRYQIISRFVLAVTAGWSLLALLKRAGVKIRIAVPLACLYLTTFAIQYWTLRQGFSSWGAAFLPLGLIPAVVYVKDGEISSWKLALALAIVLQVHVLSAFFLVLAYFGFYLYGFTKSTRKWHDIKKVALAVPLFMVLTANIWTVLLYLQGNNDLAMPFYNKRLYLFSVNERSLYWLFTPGTFFFLIIWHLVYTYRHLEQVKAERLLYVSNWMYMIFLVLSTSLFPWYYLTRTKAKFIELVQFPYRFFVPATILLLLVVGLILSRINQEKLVYLILSGMLIFGLGQIATNNFIQFQKWFLSNDPVASKKHTTIAVQDSDTIRRAFNNRDLAQFLQLVQKSTPDYLPKYSKNIRNKYNLYNTYVIKDNASYYKIPQGNHLYIVWQAHKKWASVPVIKYKNTELRLNGKKLKLGRDYFVSSIGTPIIKQTQDYNELVLTYRKPVWLASILYLSLSGWVFGLAFLIKERIQKIRN